MKVGGNAAATEFFNKHGGSSLVNESNAKKKYESKVAELYRAELDKREAADAKLFPVGVVVDGVAPPASAPAEAGEDDFFDSWDKPASAASAAAPTSATKPPGIGRATTSPPGPRTVTSASLRAGSGFAGAVSARPARLGASRLNSTTSATGASAGAKKLGGLRGAAKAAPIDFAKAQAEAEAEEERIKQLGYDRQREEEDAKEKARLASESASASKAAQTSTGLGGPAKTGLTPSASTSSSSGPAKLVGHQKGNSQDMSRLGMGMKRLALGNVNEKASSSSPTPSISASAGPDESTHARTTFANAKGISSDMYFGRGVHDPSRAAEDQQRLAQFSGATAISSTAYFGREDEEGGGGGGAGGDGGMRGSDSGGMLGDGSLEGVQSAARDALARVMANPDVQNGVESLRTGALKVRS